MAKSRGTRWWLAVAVTLLAVAKTRAREDEGKEKEGPVRCHDAIPKVGALTCSVGTAFRLAGLLKVRIALAEKKIIDENLGELRLSTKLMEERTKKILLRKTKDGRIRKRMERTIHAANIIFKQMPEMTNEEETTMRSGREELERRGANWGMWPMKVWPEEIKGKLREIMENGTGPKRRRSKRSFFDGIGQGLHYAFGLATDADIFAEDEKVKKLEMRVNEELNSLQASMVENLNEISRLTKEAGRAWEDLDEKVKEEKIIEEWDALFGSITFLLDMATELKFKKDLLANNLVPSMVTMEDIRRIKEYGESSFTGLSFVTEINEETSLREVLSFVSIEKGTEESTTLVFPFIDRREEGHLMSVTPFPTKRGNATVTPTVRGVILRYERFVSEYASLSQCKEGFGRFICPGTAPRRRIELPSCLTAYAVGSVDRIRNECSFKEFRAEDGLFVEASAKRWFIFAERETQGVIDCPGSRNDGIRSFEGAFKINRGCSFSTKNIRLSAVEFADLQLTDDVEKIDLGIIPEANVSSGYKKHFEEIHRAVKDDIRKLQSDNELHKDRMQSLRKWQMGTSGALSLLMISGSGIILFAVWKERSRGRVRSGYAMELGTLNNVELRVSRQQATEAPQQPVREHEANAMELGTLNNMEPRVSRQQAMEAAQQAVREREASRESC